MTKSTFTSMVCGHSAVVQAVLLVLVTVAVSAAPGHHGRLRVGRPCSGRHHQSVDFSSASDADDAVISHHELRQAVRRVSALLGRLYDDVSQLKTDYASARDVSNIGMHVDGMPRYNEIHISDPISHTYDVAATVSDITTKLSRATVFISLLRLEEEHHEPRPFGSALQRIEDHAEHSLYGILCHFHVIHRVASAMQGTTTGVVSLSAEVDAALRGIQLEDVARPAHRHIRTFSVIYDLEQLLQHVIIVLGRAI